MTHNELTERLEQLQQDEEFTERIRYLSSAEDIAEAFTSKGIAMTAEDVETAAEMASKDHELSEEEMDQVAAGRSWFWKLNPFYWLGKALGGKLVGK